MAARTANSARCRLARYGPTRPIVSLRRFADLACRERVDDDVLLVASRLAVEFAATCDENEGFGSAVSPSAVWTLRARRLRGVAVGGMAERRYDSRSRFSRVCSISGVLHAIALEPVCKQVTAALDLVPDAVDYIELEGRGVELRQQGHAAASRGRVRNH